MFGKQGETNNAEKEKPLEAGVVKNKEVIAEYDEALSSETEQGSYLSKLEMLKNKLGLGDAPASSSGIKTNLIDNNDVATFVDWKSSSSVFVSYFLILLILVSGSLAYLTFLEKEEAKKVNIYDEDIQKIKDNIENEERMVEEGLEFQSKMIALEALLNKHIYWTNLFKYLEKNTLEEVSFSAFSGGLDGKYGLDASASDRYFTASEQIKSFAEDEFTTSVSASDLSLSEEGDVVSIGFNLNIKVKPEIFYKNNNYE